MGMMYFDGQDWHHTGTNTKRGCYSTFTINTGTGQVQAGEQNVPLPSSITGNDANENGSANNSEPEFKEDYFQNKLAAANFCTMIEDYEKASKYALQAIENSHGLDISDEWMARAMEFLADCLEKQGKHNEALNWMLASLAVKSGNNPFPAKEMKSDENESEEPSEPEIIMDDFHNKLTMAKLCLITGDYEKASKLAFEAVENKQRLEISNERMSSGMDILAHSLEKQGKHNQALKWFRSSLAIKDDKNIVSHVRPAPSNGRKQKNVKKSSKRKSRRG